MDFSSQEYWHESPFPSPGDLSNPGIELESLESPTLVGGFFTSVPPGKPINTSNSSQKLISDQMRFNSGADDKMIK